MFYLPDLPSDDVLNRLAVRYPQLKPKALKTCLMLLKSSSALWRLFDKSLSHVGLSQGQFMILAFMNREPEIFCTPTQLAESLNVSRATITALLDMLEENGLIVRSMHEQDRRKMSVLLTAKGRGTMDELMPGYYLAVTNLMSNFSSEEFSQFTEMLARLAAGLETLVLP